MSVGGAGLNMNLFPWNILWKCHLWGQEERTIIWGNFANCVMSRIRGPTGWLIRFITSFCWHLLKSCVLIRSPYCDGTFRSPCISLASLPQVYRAISLLSTNCTGWHIWWRTWVGLTRCVTLYVCVVSRVRNSNLGLCFPPFKCCVSQLSVDQMSRNLVNF